MPAQTAKTTSLSQKLGAKLKHHFDKSKMQDTTFSAFSGLPAGIQNGIAKLVECKFDTVAQGKENAGEIYFYAAGIMVTPETFTDKTGNTHRIEGMRTSIVRPLYDTPQRENCKTAQEHLDWILNELRKLGLDTASLTFDQLEEACAALKTQDIYFKVRTWGGDEYKDKRTGEMKQGRVNESWEGAVSSVPDASDPMGAVQDDTTPPPVPAKQTPTAKPQPNGVATNRMTAPAAKPTAKAAPAKAAPKPAPAPEPEVFSEFNDLDSLAERADAGDVEAQKELTTYAMNGGATNEDVDGAASWAEVAEMCRMAAEAPAADDTEDACPLTVGNVYKFKPINPTTNKPDKRVHDVEVMSVNVVKGVCNLRNCATEVKYQNVPIDQVIIPGA